MRRAVLYGLGWLAAAAVAVTIAWQGVGLVGRRVTDSHPRALTADEARAALGSAAAPQGGPGPGGAPDETVPQSGGPTGTGAETTSTTAGSRPRTTATTTSTRPPASGPTATTSPPPAPSATPTTTAGVVRTYNLVGGSATLRFDPSGKVTVVWANPNPGYRAEIDDRSDGGVRVRFDGSSHRSELEAWWDGGPQDRVEEQGGDGGGSGGSGPG
jgi:hypothetical protein